MYKNNSKYIQNLVLEWDIDIIVEQSLSSSSIRKDHKEQVWKQCTELFPLPNVRYSVTVLDNGFHVVDSRIQVLDSTLFQWISEDFNLWQFMDS